MTLPTPQKPAGPAQWQLGLLRERLPEEHDGDGPGGEPRHPERGAPGAPVEFQVTQLIPAIGASESYSTFSMTDTLDSKLTPTTDTSKISVASGTTTLAATTDYTASWSGQKLTVTFTTTGLTKLQAGKNVVFDFQATVNAVGAIDNAASVNLNGYTLTPGQTNGPAGSPSTTVTTRWGDLTFKTVNTANTSEGLAGAQYQLYLGSTDQSASCTSDISTGFTQVQALTGGSAYVLTSASDGTVTVPGLWVGDTRKTVGSDGTVSGTAAATSDFTQRCYVLKQITAPTGFVLPSGSSALTPVIVKSGTNGSTALATIPNAQQSIPALPLTGSNLQVTLTIGGIAVILIATSLLFFAFAGASLPARSNNGARPSGWWCGSPRHHPDAHPENDVAARGRGPAAGAGGDAAPPPCPAVAPEPARPVDRRRRDRGDHRRDLLAGGVLGLGLQPIEDHRQLHTPGGGRRRRRRSTARRSPVLQRAPRVRSAATEHHRQCGVR